MGVVAISKKLSKLPDQKVTRWKVGELKCSPGRRAPHGLVNVWREQIIPTSKYIPAGEKRNVPLENR